MKLLSLTLHNFKGIKDFTLDLQGRDVSVFGDNGTGKTTLMDAFTWLLFDKDSQDKKDFSIKTLDAENNPIPGLDHEVEAELDLGGRTITLKKSYKEVYTKKRGSAEATFTGHTTDYFVDGVPVKKKEYDETIAEIADEGVFKLLTNPRFFNDKMSWQDRRRLLLEVCGDVSDQDVIASDKALKALPDILGSRTMDKHRDAVKAKMTAINKELQQIPVRVDEATRALPGLPKSSREAYENELNILASIKTDTQERRLRIESGGEIAEKRKALAELDAELQELKNDLRADIDAGLAIERRSVRQCDTEISTLSANINRREQTVEVNREKVENIKATMAGLRDVWVFENDRAFEFEMDDTCPTCRRPLPPEQIEGAREKALADFNRNKADQLEHITADGKEKKAQAEEAEQMIAEIEAEIAGLQKDLGAAEADKAAAEARLDALEKQAAEVDQNPAYLEKLEGRQILVDAITALQDGKGEELAQVLAELVELDVKIKATQAEIAKFDARTDGEARIEELQEQERTLAAEYEGLERELHLCDEFTRAKVRLLDEKINSKFGLARFKMFNVLVNGSLEETCVATYKGVPFDSGLNNGAQIQVGCDIIRTLSEYYGFHPPMFVDNKESVSSLPDMSCQIISLVVSPNDKELRINFDGGGM